jgi:putative transcriptional regulator
MTQPDYLTNHILIAMPSLADANFFQTAVLICQHTEEGAMGIILNRPTDISLHEILGHLGVSTEASPPEVALTLKNTPVYIGGPVQRERGFVLHEPPSPGKKWESSVTISDQIAITSSKDILEAIAAGTGPTRCFCALGYSAWAPGQLEQELAQNSWLSGPMKPELVFETEDDFRWEAAAASIGVDLLLLSQETGHG